MVTMIEENIRAGEWYFARETAAELIKTTLEGLRYLQTYGLLSSAIMNTSTHIKLQL